MKSNANYKDRGYAWIIALNAVCITFLSLGSARSFGVIIREIIYTYGELGVGASWIMAVNGFFAMASGIISSCLSSKFGLGFGMSYTMTIITLNSYFTKYKSLANGLAVAGTGCGSLIFPLLYDKLLANFGLYTTLICIASISLQITVFGAFLRPFSYFSGSGLKMKKTTTQTDHQQDESDSEVSVTLFRIVSKSESENVVDVDKNCKGDGNNDGQEAVLGERGKSKSLNCLSKNNRGMENFILDGIGVKKVVSQSASIRRKMSSVEAISYAYKADEEGEKEPGGGKNSSTAGKQLFDGKLLKNFNFLILLLAMSMSNAGNAAYYVLLPSHAKDLRFSEFQGALLVSVASLADLLGRLIFGFLGDFHWFKLHTVFFTSILCGGLISCFLMPFLTNLWSILSSTALYAFFSGCFLAFIPVILIEELTLPKFPTAFPMVLFGQGVMLLLYFPFIALIGGWAMKKRTKNSQRQTND
ncbi:DgyrCDS13694 [Dimorphilus gyrociliatus]|uniref:DgyrCDS13694 n=1 Tax=Dimorphilus gyrociliatus TaxID=2664684 RepID=A0A7I8WBK1_9ANNE|nr:DgyrCDS13694 [Dimorphilus gyrociliatus]